MESLWKQCTEILEAELSAQEFNTWIRPLQAFDVGDEIHLLAPNAFVRDWVRENLQAMIDETLSRLRDGQPSNVIIRVGSRPQAGSTAANSISYTTKGSKSQGKVTSGLRENFSFDSFVEGKSNQLARATSIQVAENPGRVFNPLLIYGGVGLGKTHLMHAIGNAIERRRDGARVVYLHSERFVGDMVSALQHNTINKFKDFYRSVDALLIDDIQFFARKERSQEEFFHTFNALVDGQQQVVLSCDRYPKEVDGLEERLRSRFGWGLTVAVEPPELETRAAILMKKAEAQRVRLPAEVALFIAQRIRSNVRELEGALRRVTANARFTKRDISLDLTRETLKDLLALQDKLVTIDNIQKTVAQFYKLRVADLTSKRRTRSIARPRQVAMALAKELTSHSLPEIGDAFGGRDHTTVLHACRKVGALRENDFLVDEEYRLLLRMLST